MIGAHFRRFARYNAWANARLYAACAALPPAAYHAPRPAAYFRSLHGTLNHILVGDRAWLGRLAGSGPVPAALDAELYADLASLRAARSDQDAALQAFVDGLDDAGYAATVTYRNFRGQTFTDSRADILGHLFNHQTHHRGQAHALLKDAGVEPPELDMIFYLRERR